MIFGYVLIWIELILIFGILLHFAWSLIERCGNGLLYKTARILLAMVCLTIAAVAIASSFCLCNRGIWPTWVVPSTVFGTLFSGWVYVLLTQKRIVSSQTKIAVFFLIVLGSFVLTWGYQNGCLASENERLIHDLVRKAYEHNGDPVKPEDNAYLIYQHAGEYLNENHRRDLLSSDYGDPSHFEDEAIEAIQGCSWILGEMQKAASTPGYYHPFNVDDFLDDNFLSDFFMLMKFSKMSAVYFAYQGDFNQASLYLRALEQFGERVYEQEGTLIGTLMGVAYLQHERSGAESCLFLAGEQAFPGGKELPADLMLSNEVLSRSLDMELAFVVNQFAQYDESEHSLSALFWDIDWDYPEWLEIIDPVWFIFYTFTANHQLKATITHLHQLQKNFRTPCDQMFNRWEDMLADAPRMFREDSDSNFSLLMYSNCRLQAIHDIKRTAWAVHHYRVDKHTFPTCVGDLTPAYIETIPLDPFTNEPLELEFMAEGLSIHSMGVPDLKSTAMEFHMGAAYEKYRLNPPEEDEEI